MQKSLNYSLLLIVCISVLGCKNKFRYPKDLKTGVYEVTAIYKYPNDSNITEVLNYSGPQKNQSSLIFTYSGNGYSKNIFIREVIDNPSTVYFQITNLNIGNVSSLNCSFETIERKKNFLHIAFHVLSQQGNVNFEAGELTLKKVQ